MVASGGQRQGNVGRVGGKARAARQVREVQGGRTGQAGVRDARRGAPGAIYFFSRKASMSEAMEEGPVAVRGRHGTLCQSLVDQESLLLLERGS